jgi:hypothetical protein
MVLKLCLQHRLDGADQFPESRLSFPIAFVQAGHLAEAIGNGIEGLVADNGIVGGCFFVER